MYTSPSVLQFARTVDIGLFRKTGWPDRAWWLWSSTTTTTTSLTNFRLQFSWSDQTREPRRNRLGLQFSQSQSEAATMGSSWSENGAHEFPEPMLLL